MKLLYVTYETDMTLYLLYLFILCNEVRRAYSQKGEAKQDPNCVDNDDDDDNGGSGGSEFPALWIT